MDKIQQQIIAGLKNVQAQAVPTPLSAFTLFSPSSSSFQFLTFFSQVSSGQDIIKTVQGDFDLSAINKVVKSGANVDEIHALITNQYSPPPLLSFLESFV